MPLGALLELLFPPVCLACHRALPPRFAEATASASLLCGDCHQLLRPLDPESSCPKCGCFPFRAAGAGCEECEALPASFTSARSAFPYSGPAGAMIRHMKYQHAPYIAPCAVDLAAEVVGDWLEANTRDTTLAPVPMRLRRELSRGYNQARLLAQALARRYGAPVLGEDDLVRARWSGPQARHHTHAARLENLQGAFAVRSPDAVRGLRFMVVDDVMTSGATAAFAAQALRDAGAREVVLFSIVRASLGEGDSKLLEATAS